MRLPERAWPLGSGATIQPRWGRFESRKATLRQSPSGLLLVGSLSRRWTVTPWAVTWRTWTRGHPVAGSWSGRERRE